MLPAGIVGRSFQRDRLAESALADSGIPVPFDTCSRAIGSAGAVALPVTGKAPEAPIKKLRTCRSVVKSSSERFPLAALECTDVEVLLQFAKKLSLLDAVDSQVGFQISIQLDDFGRIAGLLDDEVDQECFQLAGPFGTVFSCSSVFSRKCRWRRVAAGAVSL